MQETADTDFASVENDGAVRVLAFNRPTKGNALNSAMLKAMNVRLERAINDKSVKAIVLTGSGKHFSAGVDLGEFANAADHERKTLAEARAEMIFELQRRLRASPKPVVAAVKGAAIGAGAAVALSGDMVIVGADLKLSFPELNLGMVPTAVVPSLVKHAGLKATFELLTQGAILNAEEVCRLGLANRMVASGDVLDAAMKTAKVWEAIDPPKLADTKALLYRMAESSLEASLVLGETYANERR